MIRLRLGAERVKKILHLFLAVLVRGFLERGALPAEKIEYLITDHAIMRTK